MPGGKGNIKGSDNTNGFQKNPQNINMNGRPRKSFATINADLRKKGVTPLTKSDMIDAYGLIFNSTDEELEEIKHDKKTPLVLRLIIKEFDKASTKSRALADYRDYMFGKAKEHVEVSQPEMTREERLQRIDELRGIMRISKKAS